MADTKDDVPPSEDTRQKSVEKSEAGAAQNDTPEPPSEEPTSTEPEEKNAGDDTAPGMNERKERFKALQARAKNASKRNLKETAAESHRLATDPNLLTSVSRKHAFASHNLLKADTEADGEDFERKRAWDWTVEESERWDRRMDKKQKHRANVAFQDYGQDAHKVYKRQLGRMDANLEAYEKQKAEAVMRAARSGGLEIVESEDGELVAVDKHGTFYATANSTDFTESKPDRAAVDRLVADLQKAEETRLKKRRDRGQGDDEGDVTYINDKNKLFNQKLARFYNKYTAEIRDSFERGTMI